MSIIYDALKKVEKNNDISTPSDSKKAQAPKGNFILLFILSVLVIIFGCFAGNQFFNFISKNQSNAGLSGNAAQIISKAQVPALAQVQGSSVSPDLPVKTTPPSEAGSSLKPKEEIKKTQPPELSIEGIMYSPESSFALINKRIVKVGDKVSGAAVVRITKSEVEFKIDDLSFKLSTNIK